MKVIIFGVQDFAELACFYLRNDSPYEVIAFCVHQEFIQESRHFCGLPVVSFEQVEKIYPPAGHSFFAPMSPKNMNKLRREIYENIKAKGYSLIKDNEIIDIAFIEDKFI